MPAETYASTAYGAVRRIRTPHDHDILLGRGGGINSFPGNQVFRQWVAERKEEYNLAPNKHEKTRVAEEVMARVRNQTPPGRFLQRDPTAVTGPVWWVEVDEARALAKTSQALREGAPQIRMAHKDELKERPTKTKRQVKRKRKSATTPSEPEEAAASMPPPLPPTRPFVRRLPSDEYSRAMENLQANVREAKDLADQKQRQQQQGQDWEQNSKRVRLMEKNTPHVSPGSEHYPGVKLMDSFSETPPLLSVPTPPGRMESFDLGSSQKPEEAFQQAMNAPAPPTKSLPRVHSLALSDYSMSDTNVFDENGNFVNPFEDESNIANNVLRSRQTSHGQRFSADYLRNLSSNEDNNGISEPGLDRTWEEDQQQQRYVSLF